MRVSLLLECVKLICRIVGESLLTQFLKDVGILCNLRLYVALMVVLVVLPLFLLFLQTLA